MERAKKRVRRSREADPTRSGPDGLRLQVARVRARYGVDPEVPEPVLSKAWVPPSGAVEEDEAELVDAVADCLSAGLPLDAALASWVSGKLALTDDEDDTPDVVPFAAIRRPGRHRIVVH